MQTMNSLSLYKYDTGNAGTNQRSAVRRPMAVEEEKSCSSSSASSRWNPTKEQISMLEAMYGQGIRTPTADEIQQIARKLREFGSIEGKNVFYWFQNHKARQRQRQKQENIACFNRFLRRAAAVSSVPLLPHPVSLPPPACTNNTAVCSPYYQSHANPAIGYYPPFPNMLVPGRAPTLPTESELQTINVTTNVGGGGYIPRQPIDSPSVKDPGGQETLQLFPLHPTGILEERSAISSTRSTSADSNNFLGEEAQLQVAEEEDDDEEEGRGFGSKTVLNFL